MTLKPTAEMRAALKESTCCDCGHDEALAKLLAVVDRERSGGDAMYRAAYFGVNEVLDKALGTEINYELLKRLAEKPHPLLNIAEDLEAQIRETPIAWTGEVFQEARTAHHLLDMVGIPHGEGYAQDLDSRTWLAVNALATVRDQLARIATWHSRATYPGGMVGDTCIECGLTWPCETRRMADGTHEDLTEETPNA